MLTHIKMKKLKNNLIIVLILMNSFFIFNCDNQNNETIGEDTSKLIFEYNIDYGKIHNEGLEKYYEKYDENKTSNLSLIFERLNDINNQNNLAKSKASNEQMTAFANFFINSKNGKAKNSEFSPNTRFVELLDFFEQKDYYSNELTSLLKGFIENNSSPEEVIKKVSDFRSLENISTKDDNILYAFSSIYIASDKFWNEKESNNKINYAKSSSCSPRAQVRFADAAGGIFGALFGSALFPGLGTAIGASVGSQGMSALIEAQQDDRGGNCVY
jgi:hypothetical protein